jgi:hypothetical protein
MKKLSWLFIPVFMVAIFSCSKDDNNNPGPVTNFTATLNGANEEHPTGSAATGSAVGNYNSDTKELNLTITYTGLTPSAGHIHKGAVGVSGGVIFPFASVATSPIVFIAVLDATQEADLMAGLYYVNLHTAAFPGGEIRGQLVK